MIDVRRIVAEHRRVVYLIVGALVVNIALYALVVFPLARRVPSPASSRPATPRASSWRRRRCTRRRAGP